MTQTADVERGQLELAQKAAERAVMLLDREVRAAEQALRAHVVAGAMDDPRAWAAQHSALDVALVDAQEAARRGRLVQAEIDRRLGELPASA